MHGRRRRRRWQTGGAGATVGDPVAIHIAFRGLDTNHVPAVAFGAFLKQPVALLPAMRALRGWMWAVGTSPSLGLRSGVGAAHGSMWHLRTSASLRLRHGVGAARIQPFGVVTLRARPRWIGALGTPSLRKWSGGVRATLVRPVPLNMVIAATLQRIRRGSGRQRQHRFGRHQLLTLGGLDLGTEPQCSRNCAFHVQASLPSLLPCVRMVVAVAIPCPGATLTTAVGNAIRSESTHVTCARRGRRRIC